MILENMQKALETLGLSVYYGRTFASENDKWNYIVFNRNYMNKTGRSDCDYNYYYQVHIIHEEYIPEDMEKEVIQLMKSIHLRLTNNSHQFTYTIKNDTLTIEMLTLEFTRTLKGCDV